MKTISVFIIISLILVIPVVATAAQETSIAEKAKQKSVKVVINEENEIHVKHVVSSSNSPRQVELIDGTVENLIITDEQGREQLATKIGDNNAVVIFPSNNNSIIEYDLKDVLLLKNNVWTLDFLYLETTKFFLPENLDLVFVNDGPVYLEGKKAFACHGCQMTLEYSLDEPTKIMEINWEDKRFFVEVRTFLDIQDFNFNQPKKEINFKINDGNQFVTTIIPLELLGSPYAVFLDEDKIYFNQYTNNGTHVWITMKPDALGEISMVGTTAVPEFSIIAPLVIGFFMIMMIPMVKKLNLH